MMFLRNAIFAILIVLIKMDASIVDKDLIERINKGEEKAFEVLYNSYFVYLCACANSYIFNPVEAQDIVNETFAKNSVQPKEKHKTLMNDIKDMLKVIKEESVNG